MEFKKEGEKRVFNETALARSVVSE